MPKVTALFNARLTTPIRVELGRRSEDFQPLKCLIRVGKEALHVVLSAATVTSPKEFSEGDPEPGEITDVAVRVQKDVRVERGPEGLLLAEADEETFERVMVDAVGLFVRGVRQTTRDWALDVSQPIRFYTVSYKANNGGPVRSHRPRDPDYQLRIPGDIQRLLLSFTSIEELNPTSWSGLQNWMDNPVMEVPHEELLHDASVFLERGTYDVALLFGAFALELLVKEICRALLLQKGLTDKQCEAILAGRRAESQIQLLGSIASQVDVKNLTEILQRRNGVSHKGRRPVRQKEALSAIRAAEELEKLWQGLSGG